MILRFSNIIWLLGVVLAAFGLYMVKYEVQAIKEEVKVYEAKLKLEQEALHVAQAEWAYLNNPERLLALTEKYLNLEPLRGDQMIDVAMLSMPPQDMEDGMAALIVQQPMPASVHLMGGR